MVVKAQTTLANMMPVVVALGSKGLYVIRLKDGESGTLASFPEDLNRVAFALSETYAAPMPFGWIKQKLKHLLNYLDLHEAYLIDGDLVAIIDGKPYGLKTYPEVIADTRRLFGNDMELFLRVVYDLMDDLKKHFVGSR